MVFQSWEGLVSGENLDKEHLIRKKDKDQLKVDLSAVPDYIAKGFKELERTSKKAKLVRYKDVHEKFENEVWRLLYDLEFNTMNCGNSFRIPVTDNSDINPKQIDVFAFDGQVALIIECKSAECEDNSQSKSCDFKQTLLEIKANKEYQSKAIREYFKNQNIDIGFVLFTRKYRLGDANKLAAKQYGISVLNEYDLKYYNALYKSLGTNAKYQILSDVFKNQPLKSIENSVPAIKGKMGGYTAYTFLIEPKKLLPLAFVAHRRTNDEDTDTSYYQRMLTKNKLKEIKNFVQKGNFFANNIIVSIDSKYEPNFEEKSNVGSTSCGILHLPNTYRSMWVIDGQHRLFGYNETIESETALLPVTAFYKLEESVQSKIFVDINNKQKKVDSSLLIDIDSRAKIQSDKNEDWVAALNTILFIELSKDPKSALYNKVKDNYRNETKGDITSVSLKTVMEKSKLIGDLGKSFVPGPLYMRKGQDEREATKNKAKKFFEDVFTIFNKYCPSKWNCTKNNGGFLATPGGMTAIILTIRDIIQIAHSGETPLYEKSEEALFKPMEKYVVSLAKSFEQMGPEEIKKYRSRQGADGQDKNNKEMLLLIHNNYPNFTCRRLEKYIEDSDVKYTENVKNNLENIEKLIHDAVRHILEDIDGKWYKQEEFRKLAEKLSGIRIDKGKDDDPLLDFLDVSTSYEFIKIGGRKYFKCFERSSKEGKSFENRTSWIDLFIDLRKKLNQNEKIMKEESEQFDIENATIFNLLNNVEDIDYDQ